MAAEQARIVRVFVSSPGDVRRERECVARVLQRINRQPGLRDLVRIDAWQWEVDATPQIGPPVCRFRKEIEGRGLIGRYKGLGRASSRFPTSWTSICLRSYTTCCAPPSPAPPPGKRCPTICRSTATWRTLPVGALHALPQVIAEQIPS